MTQTVTLPLWLLLLILAFAAVTFASHFLFPSVRWFLRRRMERAVARLNQRLARPIQPFNLLRRQDMIQRLVYDPVVTQAIVEHARATGVREDVAFERARRYAREIVPSFSATVYFGFAIRAARLLSRALYLVRVVHADDELAGVDPEATVVFVMNHRSNMDYVLVTYLAANRSALSYAMGEWARVWPLSSLLRALGGYFIRRKSNDSLYRRVLARYVQQAAQAGVTQAVFPEGRLSLDGKMGQARVGILKYIVDGAREAGRDVVFVPVALNYDRVLEDTILLEAARNGGRRFQARISVVMMAILRQLWFWLRGRYRRFGCAAVSFGAPLPLSEIADPAPEAVGEAILGRIADVMPVLPVPLVARLVLEHGPMTRSQVEGKFDAGLATMRRPGQALDHDPDCTAEAGLRILLRRGILDERDGRIAVAEGRERLAQFYANSIGHLP